MVLAVNDDDRAGRMAGETMATPQRRGLARLVATDRHSHWAEPVLRFLLDNPAGYAVGIDCDFGERPVVHYIGRDAATGRACWQRTPYTFASIAQAEAARDELAAQQPGEGE